jgi:hypothetical protein
MEKLVSRRHRGIQWVMNERLEHLEYADDVYLLAHRFTDIKGNTAIVSGDKAEKPNTESEQKELQDIFSFLSVAVYFVHSEETVVIAS